VTSNAAKLKTANIPTNNVAKTFFIFFPSSLRFYRNYDKKTNEHFIFIISYLFYTFKKK